MLKKGIITDIAMNMLSAAFPLLILQLVAFPLIAEKFGSDRYGIIVSIISIITIVSFPFGNVLNNTRLLQDKKYKEKDINGDFNLLLLGSGLFSSLSVFFITVFVDSTHSIATYLLFIMMTLFSLIREYLVVGFRLEINYKYILIDNLLLGFGYLIGVIIFKFTGVWQSIYLLGLMSSLLFLLLNLSLHKEPLMKTELFKNTFNTAVYLYISSLIKNLIAHADKILILYILGPYSVAVYYSTSVIGKTISLAINPLNSVVLSYLVKMESIKNKDIIKIVFGIGVTSIIGYSFTLLISPFFFRFFYPEWSNAAIEILPIITAYIIVEIMASTIRPFNLRFNDTKWQLYVNSIQFAIFLILGVFGAAIFGLRGFGWGILLSSIVTLILQVIILFKGARK